MYSAAGEADTALLFYVEGWTKAAAKEADEARQRIETVVTGERQNRTISPDSFVYLYQASSLVLSHMVVSRK